MFSRLNSSSGVPIYLQLMEQIKHAIETGALRPGDQLPGIRKVAEDLVMNPNTVAKAYRELEHEGVIDLRQGAGAFVSENGESRQGLERLEQVRPLLRAAMGVMEVAGMSEDEMRRLFEAELTRLREKQRAGDK